MKPDGFAADINSIKREPMKYLVFIPLLFLSACTAFIPKPEVSVKDVKLSGVNSGGVTLDVYLSVNNTSSYDLKMKSYSYDVKIMALPMAMGSSTEPYYFYAKTTTDVLIPVRISYNDLLEILKRRPDPDAILYQFHADLAVETFLGDMAIPVNKSGTFAVPRQFLPTNIYKKIGDLLNGLQK
jgi:LEA14-like dessication related protein